MVNALGDHNMARQMAEQSLVLFRGLGDQRGLADGLLLLGHAMLWQGEVVEGYARLLEALALYREAGDRLGVARTLAGLGSYLADWAGDRSGRAMLEESVAILKELGDRYFIASALVALGIVSLGSGEFASARAHFEEALAVSRETGHVWGTADALTNLSGVARIVGDYDVGRRYAKEALQIYREQGFIIRRADPLCALAEIDIARGDLSSAQSRLQEASALVAKSENKWLQTLVSYFLGLLAYYEGDTERAAVFLDESTTIARNSQYMPDLARSLVTLGRVMNARDENAKAARLLHEGLGLFQKMESKLGIAIALEGFAELALLENAKDAMHFMKAAEAIRNSIGAPLPPIDRRSYESSIAIIQSKLGETAFNEGLARAQAEPWTAVVTELMTNPNSAYQSAV